MSQAVAAHAAFVMQAAVQHRPPPLIPQTPDVHCVLPVQGVPAARPPASAPVPPVVPPLVPPVVLPPVVVPPDVPELEPLDESLQALARMKPNPASNIR